VFVDVDQNGVADAGDFPLGGVQIDLFGTDDAGAATLLRSVTTDSDGNYSFTGLAAGAYTVVEHQPAGYADGRDYVGTAGGAQSAADEFSGVVLADGQQAAGYVFTERAGSLSGRVLIPDENPSGFAGQPGVVVELSYVDALGATVTLTAQADADGAFSFVGLAAGTYTLTQRVPEGFTASGATVGTVDGVTPDGQAPGADAVTGIVLGAGDAGDGYEFRNVPADN
jgi:hypothetical protein